MILILVCFVQKGIPVYFLEEINEADLNRIYDRQFIIIKNVSVLCFKIIYYVNLGKKLKNILF